MITSRNVVEWGIFVMSALVIASALVSEFGRTGRTPDEIAREIEFYRVKAAIELYAEEHQGQWPPSLDALTQSDSSAAGNESSPQLGPYLTESPDDSFQYDPANGSLSL